MKRSFVAITVAGPPLFFLLKLYFMIISMRETKQPTSQPFGVRMVVVAFVWIYGSLVGGMGHQGKFI